MKIPFSVYDFFGYLAAGYLVLAAADLAFGGGWVLVDSMPIPRAIVWVLLAYVLGHLVAHISSVVIESWWVREIIGSPEGHLLKLGKDGWWSRRFPGNRKPLPDDTIARIKKQAETRGATVGDRGFFYHCHPIVKRDQATHERLNNFLKLYGFCRNLSMAFLIAGALFVAAFIRERASVGTWNGTWLLLTALAVVLSVGMLYRYLKFFRHYTLEVFMSYAEPAPSKEGS